MRSLEEVFHHYYGQKCVYTNKKRKVYGTIIAIADKEVVIENLRSNRKRALPVSEIKLLLNPLQYAINYQADLQAIFDGEFQADAFLEEIIQGKFSTGWDFSKLMKAVNLLRSKGIDCDGLIEARLAKPGNAHSLSSRKITLK